MIGSFAHGYTVVIKRRVPLLEPGGERVYDDYGVLQYAVIRSTVTDVPIWPSSSTEVGQGNERSRVAVNASFPLSISIDAVDAIEWEGKTFQVDGEPEYYRNPMSGTAHQVVALVRVEG